MHPIRLVCACLALTLLVACDKEAPPKPGAPPAPPPVSSSPPPAQPAPADVPAPPVESVPAADPKPVPSPPTPAPKLVPPTPAPIKPKETLTTVKAPLPKAKLDLSLPKDLVNQLEPGDAKDDVQGQAPLPQLFAERPAENSFGLNGKLITNERETDAWHSVEGAELQFEFKR